MPRTPESHPKNHPHSSQAFRRRFSEFQTSDQQDALAVEQGTKRFDTPSPTTVSGAIIGGLGAGILLSQVDLKLGLVSVFAGMAAGAIAGEIFDRRFPPNTNPKRSIIDIFISSKTKNRKP